MAATMEPYIVLTTSRDIHAGNKNYMFTDMCSSEELQPKYNGALQAALSHNHTTDIWIITHIYHAFYIVPIIKIPDIAVTGSDPLLILHFLLLFIVDLVTIDLRRSCSRLS